MLDYDLVHFWKNTKSIQTTVRLMNKPLTSYDPNDASSVLDEDELGSSCWDTNDRKLNEIGWFDGNAKVLSGAIDKLASGIPLVKLEDPTGCVCAKHIDIELRNDPEHKYCVGLIPAKDGGHFWAVVSDGISFDVMIPDTFFGDTDYLDKHERDLRAKWYAEYPETAKKIMRSQWVVDKVQSIIDNDTDFDHRLPCVIRKFDVVDENGLVTMRLGAIIRCDRKYPGTFFVTISDLHTMDINLPMRFIRHNKETTDETQP